MTTDHGPVRATGISVVVLAKNEERAITGCLDSVAGIADQVVVVDSHSTDRTRELAEQSGAVVVPFTWDGCYPKKKEWSLRSADLQHDWVLLLDADERVSPELATEVLHTVQQGELDGLDIPLAYHWRGHRLRHGQTVHKLSLFRRSVTHFPDVADLDAPGITEVEGHYQPRVDGRVGRASSLLLHDDPDPLSDWFDRHNRYSDWEAHLRNAPAVRRSVRAARSRRGRVLDRLPGKPLAVFAYGYLLKGGWRDGRPGFEYAASLAFYQLQIGMKLRELQDDERVDS